MPALGAGARVIGDLIGGKAGARADLLRRIIECPRGVLIGDRELAGGMERGERRILLDGQLIEREMLGRFRKRALEFGGPGLRRLPRSGIDQVE